VTWHGWLWCTRWQRWNRVCSAEGLGQCSRDLGAIVKLRGTKDRYATMTTGAEPTFRPAGRKASGERQAAPGGAENIETGKPSEDR